MNLNSCNLILIGLLIFVATGLVMFGQIPIFGLWETTVFYKSFDPLTANPLYFLDIQVKADSASLPGLFLYFPRLLTDFFGFNMFLVRIMSIFLSLLSLYLFFIIIKRCFSKKVAFMSTLLLATNTIFIIFEHQFLVQPYALFSVFLCIERYQTLRKKATLFNVISFSFVLALSSVGYIVARIIMLLILLAYALKVEDLLYNRKNIFINTRQHINRLCVIVISYMFFLTLFYPFNLINLNRYFIFPWVGEYSNSFVGAWVNITHNLRYFYNFYIINAQASSFPMDVIIHAPFPLEHYITYFFIMIGIIWTFAHIKQSSYFNFLLFFLMSLLLLFNSEVFPNRTFDISSTLSIYRAYMLLPWLCLFAGIGFNAIIPKRIKMKRVFGVVFFLFVFYRIFLVFSESQRYNEKLNEFKVNLLKPTPVIQHNDKIPENNMWMSLRLRKDVGDKTQVYLYQLAKQISKKLQSIHSIPEHSAIYIDALFYEPNYMLNHSFPHRGNPSYPYFYKLFLSFYLNQFGYSTGYYVEEEKKIYLSTKFKKFRDELNDKKSGAPSIKRKVLVKLIENPILSSILDKTFDFFSHRPTINQSKYSIENHTKRTPKVLLLTNKDELNYYITRTNRDPILILPVSNE